MADNKFTGFPRLVASEPRSAEDEDAGITDAEIEKLIGRIESKPFPPFDPSMPSADEIKQAGDILEDMSDFIRDVMAGHDNYDHLDDVILEARSKFAWMA
jgi:hypothetical protein